MEIKISKIKINFDDSLSPKDAESIRGFLGRLFWENPYVHHHNTDGSLIYQYPKLQYKVINQSFLLIGFLEGEEIIKKIFIELEQFNIEGKWQLIIEKKFEVTKSDFGIAERSNIYRFLTPWLALNEKNYEQYQKLGTWAKRKALLEKIIIGNLISIAKSLGYTVSHMICPDIIKTKEVAVKLKGIPMIGFMGEFAVNFDIPDYWGIGKSVSRGFGTVIKVLE